MVLETRRSFNQQLLSSLTAYALIETLAAVRQAGLSRVGLVTEPPERR